MRTPRHRPLLSHWGWEEHAVCRGMDSDIFFSPPGERGRARRTREQQAQSLCRLCPVRSNCADFAAETGERYGVWGGTTERDRTRPAAEPDPARTPAHPNVSMRVTNCHT